MNLQEKEMAAHIKECSGECSPKCEYCKDTEDLAWEHEQHTSDDWKNLKDRCSLCWKACQFYSRGYPEVGRGLFQDHADDYKRLNITENPL